MPTTARHRGGDGDGGEVMGRPPAHGGGGGGGAPHSGGGGGGGGGGKVMEAGRLGGRYDR